MITGNYSSIHYSANLLQKHQMIIFGGMTPVGKSNETYSLNVATHEWSLLNVKKPPPSVDGHSCVIHKDKLYLFGGRKSNWISTNTIHVLNFETLEWELVESKSKELPIARVGHGCVYEPKHQEMIIFGGYDDKGQFLGRRNDLWIFNFENLTWKEINCGGKIPPEICCHKTVLIGDKMITFGGWDNNKVERNDVYELDLSNYKWEYINVQGNSPSIRRNHCAVVYNNEMMILGGFGDYRQGGSAFYNDIHIYQNKGETVEKKIDYQEFKIIFKDKKVLNLIFEFGSGLDVLNWSLVCKSWKESLNSFKTWDNLYSSLWKSINQGLSLESKMINKYISEKLSLHSLKNRNKKDFILLNNVVSYCDDLSNFKLDFLTSFIALANINLDENSSISYLFKKYLPNHIFYLAIFSTRLGEYPLMKSLIVCYKKKFYHFFSPLLVKNETKIEEVFQDVLLPKSSFEIFNFISLMTYTLSCVEPSFEIKEISIVKKNELQALIMNEKGMFLWKLTFCFVETSKGVKLELIK